jgi:hypothetical protein
LFKHTIEKLAANPLPLTQRTAFAPPRPVPSLQGSIHHPLSLPTLQRNSSLFPTRLGQNGQTRTLYIIIKKLKLNMNLLAIKKLPAFEIDFNGYFMKLK